MKFKDWLLDNIATIVFVGLILVIAFIFTYFSIIDSRNPSPEGEVCGMKAREQELAYIKYRRMNKICENQGLEFLSLDNFEKWNKETMDERCTLDYCYYRLGLDISEKFYCKNKGTHEIRWFTL